MVTNFLENNISTFFLKSWLYGFIVLWMSIFMVIQLVVALLRVNLLFKIYLQVFNC